MPTLVRKRGLFPFFSTMTLLSPASLAALDLLPFVISGEKRLEKDRIVGSAQEEKDERLPKLWKLKIILRV